MRTWAYTVVATRGVLAWKYRVDGSVGGVAGKSASSCSPPAARVVTVGSAFLLIRCSGDNVCGGGMMTGYRSMDRLVRIERCRIFCLCGGSWYDLLLL